MARVSFVEMENGAHEVQEVYKKTINRFEVLLNFFKTAGHSETLVEPLSEMILETLKDGKVDLLTKELIILKVSLENGCNYCLRQHEALARRIGIPR